MQTNGIKFDLDWAFPSVIQGSIMNSTAYDVNPTDQTFSTGRPKFEAVFYSAHHTDGRQHILERRPAMQLVSKRTGRSYYMVSRKQTVV